MVFTFTNPLDMDADADIGQEDIHQIRSGYDIDNVRLKWSI
jgi:hypothetical protein